MKPWLQYVIALIVFCHGFIYIRIGSVLPAPVREWKGTSWLLGDAVGHDRLADLIVGLHVIAGLVIVACAAAMAVAPLVPGWWRPLAVVGAGIGIAAFAVFWDGQTRLLFEEGGIGLVVSAILLVAAAAFPQAFG